MQPDDDNADAIAALPELLAFYKAAKPALEAFEALGDNGAIERNRMESHEGSDELQVALQAIKNLEERHCEK